jgi:hypothetical protein
MVIEADTARRDATEAILAKLRFAVVPVESVERAVALSQALRPSVIVCKELDVRGCQALLQSHIPVVPLIESPDILIDRIRQAIRASRVLPFEGVRNN